MSFRTKKALALLLMIGLCAASAGPVEAKEKSPSDLKKIEAELAAGKAKEAALREASETDAQRLNDLKQRLVQASSTLETHQDKAERLAERLEELSKAFAAKTAKFAEARDRLSTLTASLVELSRDPPEAFLLQAEPPEDQVRRGLLLRELLPRIQDSALKLAADLKDLDRMRGLLEEQKRLTSAAQQNLAWQKKNLDQLIQTRQGSLQKTDAERAEIAKRLAALSAEAQDIRQLMQRVAPDEGKKGGEDLKTKKLTGKLRFPVAGKLLRPFGVRDAAGVVSQGLTLAGSAGGPIVAPAAGKVVFTGPFKGLGQMVILAHAGGYHSLLAGFGRIDAEVGQEVLAGEPLGILPNSPARPELYYEWRFRNEPVNPAS